MLKLANALVDKPFASDLKEGEEAFEILYSIVRALDLESDRGVALFMASYLEKLLTDLIVKALNPLDDGFGKYIGRLSQNQRIMFAYNFRLISTELKKLMEAVIKIRNRFAHSYSELRFDSQEEDIKSKIGELLPSSTFESLSARGKFSGERGRYIWVTSTIAHWLIYQTENMDKVLFNFQAEEEWFFQPNNWKWVLRESQKIESKKKSELSSETRNRSTFLNDFMNFIKSKFIRKTKP